jgi:hypothetical protein
MKNKYSFFCDAATVDSSGKVSALGIFTTVNASQFPATLAEMTFVACIEGRQSETGKHPFRINFIDDDGNNILPSIHGEIDISQNSFHANMLLKLKSVTFQRPGTYAMDLVVDDQILASESINIVLFQPQ